MRRKHRRKHKITSISHGRTKANSKENSFCFVFVNFIGKFILCYFAYAYVASENQAYMCLSKITKDKFPLRLTKKKEKEFSFEFASVLPIYIA